MLRLYFHPASTYARRVRIALFEKGIAYDGVEVNLPGREHKGEAFLARNPYGRVPVIDDGGFVLYESAAILQYLEATRPTPPLLPADARQRALVDMHVRLCDAQLGRHATPILFPKRFLPKERWDMAAMDAARREIGQHLAVIERELEGHEYLVADRFTLADLAYLPFLHFLPLMELETGPNVLAWRERLLARPSAAATVPLV